MISEYGKVVLVIALGVMLGNFILVGLWLTW